MNRRRDWLRWSVAPGLWTLAGCGAGAHDAAAAAQWRHSEPPIGNASLERELVRYATLAANSHNTQPWRFAPDDAGLLIRPDFARRTPVADPDDHHLWISLGCALENLVLAAAAFGRHADVGFDGAQLRVALAPAEPRRDGLFDAIVRRQCTRADYDGRALDAGERRTLERAALRPGVGLHWRTDRAGIDGVLDHVAEGNRIQAADPAFVAELRHWLRFNAADAVASGDGLFAGASGNPSLPGWAGRLLFGLVFDADAENDKAARQLRSSAGAVVFVAERADPAHWIDVGRSLTRFALQATALGIRTALLNQAVEPPALRDAFARWLGVAPARPDLVVRFGRGPLMPRSLRRPLDEVIDAR